MTTVASKNLLRFLKNNNVDYKLIGKKPKETYTLASLFEPIENGFYFFNGIELTNDFRESLVLVEEKFQPNLLSKTSTFLVVDGDSQLNFYKFLANEFSKLSNGVVADSAIIHPKAKIGKNVQIDHFCIIGECVIGDNVIIHNNCNIHDNTIIGSNTTIESYSDIGTRGLAWIWNEDGTKKIVQPQLGGVIIGENCILASNTIVVRGSLNERTTIGANTLLAPGCRLGHGTQLGNFVHFANNVITGGNAVIGDYSFVGSSAVFRSKVKIDINTIVGAGSVVVKNTTKSNLTLMGNPSREYITKSNPSGMPKPNNNLKTKK